MTSDSPDAGALARKQLRTELLARRQQFMAGSDAPAAATSLARHLNTVLRELEPDLLGVYWPHRFEFNAAAAVTADAGNAALRLALPFSEREPVRMHFRAWNGKQPTARDACGIPASDGAPVVPDVVLVPCVGFTASGFRLGYGGGYFDRWLALHGHVTAIGVAWSGSEIAASTMAVEAHDIALAFIVTERGVVA